MLHCTSNLNHICTTSSQAGSSHGARLASKASMSLTTSYKASSHDLLAGLIKDAVPALKTGTNAEVEVHSLLLHSGTNLVEEKATMSHSNVAYLW